MASRTLLLALHIVSVGAWLGANFVQMLVTPRLGRDNPAVAAAWSRQTMWLGQRYYPIVGALVALTGVGLVFDQDWSWGSGFIWVGIAVVVIGAVMGIAFFEPLARTRAEALESGDVSRADVAQRRIMPLALLDTALIVIAILAMVHKWQS